MNAALLHSLLCAALLWCFGKTQTCVERGQLAMKRVGEETAGRFEAARAEAKTNTHSVMHANNLMRPD